MPITLDKFREENPAYNDWPDDELAFGLHKKFYSDMDFSTFSSQIGYSKKDPSMLEKAGKFAGDLTRTPNKLPAGPPVESIPVGTPVEGIGDRVPIDPITSRPFGVEPIPTGIEEFDSIQSPAPPAAKIQQAAPERKAISIPAMRETRLAEQPSEDVDRGYKVIGGVIKRIPESAKATGLSGLQAIFESGAGDVMAGFQKGMGMLQGMPGGGSATIADLGEGAGQEFGEAAHQRWQQVQGRMTQLRDEATDGDPVAEYMYDVGSVVTDMGFAIGTGMITGNPGLIIPLMGGQAGVGTYAGRREAGEEPDMALISSAFTGTVEALTEMIPVGFLFARTGALEKILKVTVGEGLQESFSSIFQSLWDSKTINQDMTFKEAMDAAVHEFTLGAGAGAVLSTAMATYDGATGEAEKNAAFKALIDDVASTYIGGEGPITIGQTGDVGQIKLSETPEHAEIKEISLKDAGAELLAAEPKTDPREKISVKPMDERRTGDRRVDTQLRGKVSDMTPEEQYQAIYVDRMTGLHNRRAFEDLPWRSHMASVDVDSLKWVNDNMSPDTGDQMLAEVGLAIEEAIGDSSVVDGYHISGDEYYVQADSKEEADSILEKANEILASKTLTHEGKGVTKEGINITWGTSTHKDLADQLMKDEKASKEAKGERAGRGEAPPGVTFTDQAAEEPTEKPQEPAQTGITIEDDEGILHWAPETTESLINEAEFILNQYSDEELTDVESETLSLAAVPSDDFFSDNEAVHEASIDAFIDEVIDKGWVPVGISHDAKHWAFEVNGRNVEIYKIGTGMGWEVQVGVPEKDWKKANQVDMRGYDPKDKGKKKGAPGTESLNLTLEDLQAKKVPEIRAIQQELGIPAKGKKSDAIQSILDETARVKALETSKKKSKAAKKREKIKPTDNMETAIIKLGGLSWVEGQLQAIDRNNSIPGIGPLVRSEESNEGDTMDGLSRRLQDAGFIVDTDQLTDWFRTGEIVNQYTSEGLDAQMEQEARDREQDIRDQAAEDGESQEITDLAILVARIVIALGEPGLERITTKAHENAETEEDVENNFRRIAYEELAKQEVRGGEAAPGTGTEATDLGGEKDQADLDRYAAEQEEERRRREAASFDLERTDVPITESEDQGDIFAGGIPTTEADFDMPADEESQRQAKDLINKSSDSIDEAKKGFKTGDRVVVLASEEHELSEAILGRITGEENDKGLYPVKFDFNPDPSGFWDDYGDFLATDMVPADSFTGTVAKPPSDIVESRMGGTVSSMDPGETYVGFIQQPYIPTGVPPSLAGKIIRREDILRPFLKALGINLYEGGIKGKGTLGYYRPFGWETRVKNKSDLEVSAHELAHHIDDKYFHGFKRNSNRPWIKGKGAKTYSKELKGLSYDKSKVYEGFAEFVRLWMTNPVVLAERAPNFLNWFERYVDGHELGANIRQAQAGMTTWFNQPQIKQAQSKIGRHPALNGVQDSIWDQFRQSHIDRTHGILMLESSLTGRKSADKGGPTETARLASAAYSIVDRSLELGYPVRMQDGSFQFKGKGLVEILKPAGTQSEEWSLYAIGRSANELYGQGRENLFTRGQIDAMMDLETTEFKQIFDDWLEYTSGVVRFAVDMGLLSQEQVANWGRTMYLPFYRVSRAKSESWSHKLSRKIFGEGSQGVGKRGGIPGQVTVIKMLTGGTENIGDIFQNMVMNTSMLIVESLKNDARRHAVDASQRMEGGKNWITARPTSAKSVSIEKEQVIDAMLKSMGLNYRQYKKAMDSGAIDPDVAIIIDGIIEGIDEYEQFWMRGQAPNDPQVIAIKRSGKTSYYQVNDPLLYRSLISFDPPQKPIVNRVLSSIRRVMQGTVTLSLTFMGKNMWRDTQSGFVYTKSGFRPVIDTIRGMKSRISKDETYRLAMSNGMGMSSYLIDEGSLQRHIQKFHNKKGFTRRYLLDTPANMLYFMESLADAFEMSTRLGEFDRAIKHGEHPRHAAYLGREVSTDFARRGDSQISGFLYDSVPFLNAGVQGMDRGYRGLTKDDQRKQIFWRISMLASMGAIVYAIYRDDPCYKELEDWDKDSSWHFWTGTGDCSEKIHGTLTKPWEIGAIASMAERMMEELIIKPLEGEFPNIPDMGRHVARIFIEQFKMDWVPGAIEPLYEVYGANRNRYFDTPIVSPSMKGEPYTQYRHSTPRVLVEFADMLKEYDPAYQFSPVRAEALIRGYFNSWGAFSLTAVDELMFDREKPAMNWTEYPVMRAWVRKGPRRTRHETEYYDLFKEGAQLQATINWAINRGKEDNVEVALVKMEEKSLQAAIEMKKTIDAGKAAIDMIYNNQDISRSEKRVQIDELRVELNKMYKEFITEYRDLVEP